MGFLALCLYLATGALAAPENNIVSFNLSNINNQDISNDVSYFSLKNNATTPPNRMNQIGTWLNSLASHQTTSAFGDKYVAAFEIYNDTKLTEWFVYPYGSVVQSIEILSFSGEELTSSSKTGHGLKNQQDFHYGSKIEILPGQRKTLLMIFESEYFYSETS
jgi:hypothetical protein